MTLPCLFGLSALSCPAQYRFGLRGLMLLVLVCAIVLGLTTYLHRVYQDVVESVEDSYALSQVADMIIYHVKTHKGIPPRHWEDLENAYRWVNSGYNMYSFAELRAKVCIDFGRLASTLNALNDVGHYQIGVAVLTLKNGGHSAASETEANERLWSHIQIRGAAHRDKPGRCKESARHTPCRRGLGKPCCLRVRICRLWCKR